MRRHAGTFSVGLAGFVLLWALAAPTVRARSFQSLVTAALNDVGALRDASLETLRTAGSWPTPEGPGISPPEIAGIVSLDASPPDGEFVLEWRVLNTVTQAEVPLARSPTAIEGDAVPDSLAFELIRAVRTSGAIVVHSSNDELLAALQSQHGDSVSFIRDTTWTLMVRPPEGS
jgi:hypothetical protein